MGKDHIGHGDLHVGHDEDLIFIMWVVLNGEREMKES